MSGGRKLPRITGGSGATPGGLRGGSPPRSPIPGGLGGAPQDHRGVCAFSGGSEGRELPKITHSGGSGGRELPEITYSGEGRGGGGGLGGGSLPGSLCDSGAVLNLGYIDEQYVKPTSDIYAVVGVVAKPVLFRGHSIVQN